jgi:hypothetical protein
MTRDARTADLAALLEREGVPAGRAADLAALVLEQHAGTGAGTLHGGLDAPGLARLWERATFAGVRRMVLEVQAAAPTLAGDDGTLSVRILESEQWPEWTGEEAARASGMAALLAEWSEVDYLADSEAHPEIWTPEGEEPEARARAEKLN